MRKLQILVIISIMLFTTVAVAGVNYQQFKVTAVDRGTKVIVDGNVKQLSSKPLIIDGKVMVPLRDVANIFSKQVVYDSVNNKVYIGNNIAPVTTPPKVVKPAPQIKYIEDMTIVRNVGPFYEPKRAIAIAGKLFNHGVVVDVDPAKEALKATNANGESKYIADVKILLNGNYAAADGYVAVEDWSMNANKGFIIRFYGDDILLYQSQAIQPAELAHFISKDKIGNLSNIKILKIEVELTEPPIPGETSITKAALADFKFYKK